jgi:hypothetical protein
MFRDYAHRAEVFVQAVRGLAAAARMGEGGPAASDGAREGGGSDAARALCA